ncbi:MAG TPA: bifunctional 5,10-methylenetetrahydrofolate dehydrogenase/5,10-methenyltetrahydrofolate cyclohydrolase [Fastidiosipila sp.]|nr:bifunctional 5,10-methylenetetrahydrofolate dehydrogenase/5,10-methenyltetrahydrofolate cyclohydrolase [Fastidiosipila sp.]
MRLTGKEVVAAMKEDLLARVDQLKAKNGRPPKLAIVRVGEREDDLSYERGATRRMESVGVAVEVFAFPADVAQEELENCINQINNDEEINGCLLFSPLPDHLEEDRIRNILSAEKDIDGITDESMAGVYNLSGRGFSPCTPEACIKILDHYGYDLKGKRVTIVGRSLVVGKPLAMLVLARHGTVTVCHTRTVDLKERVKEAEIVFVAAGQAEMLGPDYFSEGQVVVDVGIHVNDEGNLVGDVRQEEVEPIVAALTPVPGGVGTVTTSVLVQHVVEAAERVLEKA